MQTANPWANTNLIENYFVENFCADHYFIKFHHLDGTGIDTMYGCWGFLPAISGYTSNDKTILPGFGVTYTHHEENGMAFCCPEFYWKDYYSYLKLDSCIWGDYIDVLALGIKNVNINPKYSIYPNPAKDKVYIQTGTQQAAIITLYDIRGKVLQQKKSQSSTTEMSVKGYSPGIYILSVRDQSSATTYKLQIE